MTRAHTTTCGLLLAALHCAAPARAQMPLHPPEIRTIFPIGGVQGSTVELLIDGQNVSDPSAVAVSGEGVRASVVAEKTSTPVRIVGNATARIQLEIAPGAPIGIRELRLLTTAGLTNRALFEVSRGMTALQESESNDSMGAAQQVPVPVTIEGRINPSEDLDVYRFTVQSGD